MQSLPQHAPAVTQLKHKGMPPQCVLGSNAHTFATGQQQGPSTLPASDTPVHTALALVHSATSWTEHIHSDMCDINVL